MLSYINLYKYERGKSYTYLSHELKPSIELYILY